MQPPKELKILAAYLLESFKALYGLADFGNYENRTMSLNIRQYLGMKPTNVALSVFTKK